MQSTVPTLTAFQVRQIECAESAERRAARETGSLAYVLRSMAAAHRRMATFPTERAAREATR